MGVSRKKWFFPCLGAMLTAALIVVVYHAYDNARRSTRRTLCVHNLKMIAICLEHYANGHEGRFPPTLSALYPSYLTELECFICPELQAQYKKQRGTTHPFSANPSPRKIDALCSYAYVPGLSISDSKDLVIVYEKAGNHGGMGRSLLYLDGHGAWEPPENWRNAPPNKNLPPGF